MDRFIIITDQLTKHREKLCFNNNFLDDINKQKFILKILKSYESILGLLMESVVFKSILIYVILGKRLFLKRIYFFRRIMILQDQMRKMRE